MNTRILLTGGSGRLGSKLHRILRALPDVDCFAPTREELDIADFDSCLGVMDFFYPDVVIHAAAFADTAGCERNHGRCWEVNVEGTENMLTANEADRFVYISTDYIFDGATGNYAEDDVPGPVNFYGLSKLAGEIAVRQYENTLILRAPFRDDPPWRYDRAFEDQFTSCDSVSIRAPQIVEAALSDWTGILHIGGRRRSILEMAREAGPADIGGIYRSEFKNIRLPRDTSLNSDRWLALKAKQEVQFCSQS